MRTCGHSVMCCHARGSRERARVHTHSRSSRKSVPFRRSAAPRDRDRPARIRTRIICVRYALKMDWIVCDLLHLDLLIGGGVNSRRRLRYNTDWKWWIRSRRLPINGSSSIIIELISTSKWTMEKRVCGRSVLNTELVARGLWSWSRLGDRGCSGPSACPGYALSTVTIYRLGMAPFSPFSSWRNDKENGERRWRHQWDHRGHRANVWLHKFGNLSKSKGFSRNPSKNLEEIKANISEELTQMHLQGTVSMNQI